MKLLIKSIVLVINICSPYWDKREDRMNKRTLTFILMINPVLLGFIGACLEYFLHINVMVIVYGAFIVMISGLFGLFIEQVLIPVFREG